MAHPDRVCLHERPQGRDSTWHCGDDTLEVEFDFAINHTTQSLDQALRFVDGFTVPADFLQRRSGSH